MLKRKIEKRPDKQVLINRRILKISETGASPFIQEKCNALTKNQLCESLNTKLDRRPGSLELVEKGVLQVDPGVATLIRGGSIPYPRVASTSPTLLFTVPEDSPITQPQAPADSPKQSTATPRVNGAKSRAPSRSLKDETVISRYGSLVFHNYCPSSAASSNSPSLRGISCATAERLPKHRAREVQQAELLHLEDAAQVHRQLGQEICQLNGRPPQKVSHSTTPVLTSVLQPVVVSPRVQHPPPQCFVLSSPAPSIPPPPPPPPPAPPKFPQVFPAASHRIIDGGNAALVATDGSLQTQLRVLDLTATSATAPSDSPRMIAVQAASPEPARKVASLEEIESVWLNLRRLQQAIAEEASSIGLNIYTSDGFPGAFTVATASEVEHFNSHRNHPAYQRLNRLVKDHASSCSLARLLISDRLEYLDETDVFAVSGGDDDLGEPIDASPKPVGSDLERNLLNSYLHRLGGSYYQRSAARRRRARQLSCLTPATTAAATTVNTASQPYWRNSTILPAHSDTVFCGPSCTGTPESLGGSLARVCPDTEDWVNQLCSTEDFQTTPSATGDSFSSVTTVAVAPTAATLHVTTSVPANLNLVNAPNVLTRAPDSTVMKIPRTGLFLPSSVGGSSGSSGPAFTAESSSCSIPATNSINGLLQPTQGDLAPMEFSTGDLDDIPSPPPATTPSQSHDLSDVQDFLSTFPFDEQSDMCDDVMAFCSTSPVASSVSKLPLPPEPQFFASAMMQTSESALWGVPGAQTPADQGLMDTS
ncbi:unnamed protein product [Mesocestoides corti]|nr:unnamed protein product [Mesocestoides corti]